MKRMNQQSEFAIPPLMVTGTLLEVMRKLEAMAEALRMRKKMIIRKLQTEIYTDLIMVRSESPEYFDFVRTEEIIGTSKRK